MWRQRTLASQIMVATLGILLATVALGGILDIQLTRRSMDQQYEARASAIASLVAGLPEIRDALNRADRSGTVQQLASQFAKSAGAAYVVVTDRTGLRYSHPNPALIGKRLEEPVAVLDGRSHVGIDHGSLGRSANGKAPVLLPGGAVIGQVSVGILETQVSREVNDDIAAIALYSALALGVGACVAYLLSRAIKRVTFGLELREIAALLQEREAMLHGIQEGVIGFDTRHRVTLINTEARRLLHIRGGGTGSPIGELVPPGRLRDVLTGTVSGVDQSVITKDAMLLVNRRPVSIAGRNVGSVVTLRDRTEMEALIRRMNAVSGLISALRAQEHEFTNRLHVIAGLLDLGETAEARAYLASIAEELSLSAESLRARISPPAIAALLRAKIAVAAERDVDLIITEDSHLDATTEEQLMLLAVIGNLIDNAIDAAAGDALDAAGTDRRVVTVRLEQADGIRILVTDSGPGVAPEALEDIFTDGYTTKPARGDARRGVGLALVDRLVSRARGSITVQPGPGGHFEVVLPRANRARADESPVTAGTEA
jgi:two-component system CitB family sensor kinase